MTSLFAALVAMTNMCGVVTVDTHGARVLSYIPEGGEEGFFVSETGTGGMPLCWPWVAGNVPSENSRRHGIARYKDFEVVGTERIGNDSTLTLRLKSDEETRKLFPHDFTLTVKVRMNDRLTVSMTGRTPGSRRLSLRRRSIHISPSPILGSALLKTSILMNTGLWIRLADGRFRLRTKGRRDATYGGQIRKAICRNPCRPYSPMIGTGSYALRTGRLRRMRRISSSRVRATRLPA